MEIQTVDNKQWC